MMLSPKNVVSEAFVNFNVKSGTTTEQLAKKMHQEGLIKNPLAFKIYARLKGFDKKIKSGTYLLSPSMSPREILKKMIAGDAIRDDERVTIPEGSTLEKIADIFEKYRLVARDEFLKAAKADNYKAKFDFIREFPEGATLEGFLFPDTYFFPKGKPAGFYVEKMLKRFEEVYYKQNGFNKKQKKSGFNTYQIITIASIVEAEAKLDQEKPVIAAVFYNRLEKGLPLQSCATVEYALKEHKEVLTLEDLQVDSLYNTYKYTGLPPGPIGSPGATAIAAAVNPADADYLYFVANGDGTHTFSRTYTEHLNAKNRIQRLSDSKN